MILRVCRFLFRNELYIFAIRFCIESIILIERDSNTALIRPKEMKKNERQAIARLEHVIQQNGPFYLILW